MSFQSEAPSSAVQVSFDPFADGELQLVSPLTESQKEIWASVQMGDAANCAFNESQSLQLQGLLNQQALELAFQQLVDRHESLRSTCSPDGTKLCINRSVPLDSTFIDLSTLESQDQTSQIAGLKHNAVELPFDLEHGPLFRVQVIKLAANDHLVLMTAHHIVCDGWSWAVIMTELATLYTALQQGQIPQLEEPDSYSHYANTLVNTEAEEASETLEYWKQQYSNHVPVLDFPTDQSRPALRTFNSAREDWPLTPQLVTQLKQLGARNGSSFLTTLLSGFEVFLHRLTGQSDVVVGVPAAGQAATGQLGLVGHCVNLLPLRTQIQSHQSFEDYLNQRKSAVLDAYDYQQFTFGRLVRELAIARDPSRIPLVPIIFNIDQGLDIDKLQFADLKAALTTNPRSFENFELFINAVELNGAVTLECQYNTNLFAAETIQQRLAEFEILLESIVAEPAQQIAKLALLPDAERQWLEQVNTAPSDNFGTLCIHQLFEAQVAKTPEAIAAVFENEQLTYAQLNNKANQLAHFLQHQGIDVQKRVGICIDRSLDMLIALLAILKVGGVYIPLDPSNPKQRLALLLEDAQLSALVTQEHLISELPAHQAQVICLDTNSSQIAQEPLTNLQINVPQTYLAYILYTSGSTGTPKGVQVPHSGVANLLHAMGQELKLNHQDTVLAITTIAFDISALELYLPLIIGAKVVIANREVTADGTRLKALLQQSGATFMQATPATWQMLRTIGWQGDPKLKILCGGEVLPLDLANHLTTQCYAAWNVYGPTEASIWTTIYQLQPQKSQPQAASTPIGRPLTNVQTYILDANSQPLPKGIPGELCIGGAGVALGYLNRPELTAEKFVPCPIPNPGTCTQLYKTGDLARYLPDGTIEWLSRIDDQVKIRGFRIELGEIEANFLQHPSVKEAVVIIREDTPGERSLVGYFVPSSSSTVVVHEQVAEIRQFLKVRLPDFMIPGHIMALETLPLTANGKINRKILPQPDVSQQLAHNYVAPRSDLERKLTEIWAEVFNIEKIGIHDNFFALGGHSLLAIQIMSRLRQALDIEILLPYLFESPTIADLSQRIEVLRWSVQSPVDSNDSEFEEGEL